MNQNKNQFLIALGSNIALDMLQPVEIIQRAIIALSNSDLNLLSLSRFYETPAFPTGSGPNFINSVVKVESDYSAHEILQELHKIENKFERQRSSRWSARTLDLDLLALGEQVLPSREVFQHWCDLPVSEQKENISSELILPHPRIQDRAFVLLPLLDVEPSWTHPIFKKTVMQLYEELADHEKENIQIVQ